MQIIIMKNILYWLLSSLPYIVKKVQIIVRFESDEKSTS